VSEVLTGNRADGGTAGDAGPAMVPRSASDARRQEIDRAFAEASRLHRRGQLEAAVAGYSRTLALSPRHPDAYNNLGVAMRGLGRLEAAVACYKRSLSIRPDDAGIHSNLGNALRELGRYNRAAASHQQAVTLAPQSPVAIFNLGLVLRDLGHLDEAIGCFERALAIRADYVDCRWERALTLLQKGDLQRGFQDYAWRSALRCKLRRPFEQPAWQGEDLQGRTVLVHLDQGFADMVQFARYLPLMAARGGRVIVECPDIFFRLFATVPDIESVVAAGQTLPPFDLHAPLATLPALFGTRLETIPDRVPYLTPPPRPEHGLTLDGDGTLKVGIAWAGNPAHLDSPSTHCPFHHFVDLADLRDVTIYSLQTGRAAGVRRLRACDALVRDVGGTDGDLADLAAIISEMDLVITVDSTVAHLAGALGRPAWVLLPFVSDWRWLADREDTPWYPSLCLFRQESHGDWENTFARVRAALEEASRVTAARRGAG